MNENDVMGQSQDKSAGASLSDVSGKLGRCILHLQQYEMLLKRMVANQEIAGYEDELEQLRNARKGAVGNKTLGHLVGKLTDGCLHPPTSNSDDWAED